MSRIAIVELKHRIISSDKRKPKTFIQAARIEKLQPGEYRKDLSGFSYPRLSDKDFDYEADMGETLSIDTMIENVSKKIREKLKDCCQIIVFSDIDADLCKEMNANAEIKIIK